MFLKVFFSWIDIEMLICDNIQKNCLNELTFLRKIYKVLNEFFNFSFEQNINKTLNF
jgi:hypothetical protein